jgi:hypothetical protein
LRLPINKDRIKVITANGTFNSWQRSFLQYPNAYAADFDLLINTPTMQAGQSLDGSIHKVNGWFWFNARSTHNGEHQFLSRARSHADIEVVECYVQKTTMRSILPIPVDVLYGSTHADYHQSLELT